jgi:hypothetical protein
VECFTSLLTTAQISTLLENLGFDSIASLCTALEQESSPEVVFRDHLLPAGVSGTIADEVIACLKATGIELFT